MARRLIYCVPLIEDRSGPLIYLLCALNGDRNGSQTYLSYALHGR